MKCWNSQVLIIPWPGLTLPFPQQRLHCITHLYNLKLCSIETLESASVAGNIMQACRERRQQAQPVLHPKGAQTVIL